MRLIVVRHGQTKQNKDQILMGHASYGLDRTGRRQAKLLGLRLKSERIDFIYSSDLVRTKQTVLEIIKYHPTTPVIYDERLRERNLGILEGLPLEELYKLRDASGQSRHEFKPEGGESFVEVHKRVVKFIDYLKSNHDLNDTILICTHGGWKRSFLAYVLDKEMSDEKMMTYKFQNTSVSVFDIIGDKVKQVLLNDIEHLS